MDNQMFELVRLALQLILLVVSMLFAAYKLDVKDWIIANTTAKQRENAEYWAPIIIREAEKRFDWPKSGEEKKKFVLNWLVDNNVVLNYEQLDILIDDFVEFFNKNGWDI